MACKKNGSVVYQKRNNSSVMLNLLNVKQRTAKAVADINVPLNELLTNVCCTNEGVYHVSVTCESPPETEECRELMRSAVHSTISDEFSDLQSPDGVDVQVDIPPPKTTPPATMDEYLASKWISQQLGGINEWAALASLTLSKAAYNRVIDSYPWRDAEYMRSMIDELTRRDLESMLNGIESPLLIYGNADCILPSLDALLSEFDKQAVLHFVARDLGVDLKNFLELYELVFISVQRGISVNAAMVTLYHQLFRV